MKAHPVIEHSYYWLPILLLALVLIVIQAALLCNYANAEYLPALVDGVVTVGWLAALAYLAWFAMGTVSLLQTDVIVVVVGILLWLAGSFMVCDLMVRIVGISYVSFVSTIPFRLLFGIPTWISVILWYRLELSEDTFLQEQEYVLQQQAVESQTEVIDRITVKDGTRIHLIKVDELLYIEACGDYVTLRTSSGEFIKEQTMKYLEAHLPQNTFVRIHRSTIVNVTQISRVELFGKENYQLLLKNGVKLRVSLSGYRLLKERLDL